MSAVGQSSRSSTISYSTVIGFFLQDEPDTDASIFDFTATNLGLINRTYDTDSTFDPDRKKTQWQRLAHKIHCLNEASEDHVHYKLLYMGRHGEGFHNVANDLYGTPAWDAHWSKLDGNDTMTWADAKLTPEGESQARKAHAAWSSQIQSHIPVPERYYVSPLDRCLATAHLTFADLPLPKSQPFVPEVKELVRETIGIHTCDRRSSKTYIHAARPSYIIEPSLTEEDELWHADERETNPVTDARLKKLLDDVFVHDKSTYISLTSHSGAIASMLRVLGHRDFWLNTGAMITVLVRAEMPMPPN